jgi:dimethylamine monooxygenase subunit A
MNQPLDQPLYLPFEESQWRMKLGLKSLQLQDWIEIDNQFVAYLQRKQELLQQRHSDVFAAIGGSEVAQAEVLSLLLDHLFQYFPDYYQQEGDQIKLLLTQQTWQMSDFEMAPLDLAGRLVQEDLCLMQPGTNGYVLVAGSLCFPSNWRLQEKLGQPIAHIHDPVPQYGEKLETSVNSFFDRLKVEHPGYRFNWAMVDTPELFLGDLNSASSNVSAEPDDPIKNLWIRIERQTLRRLPISNSVLFTIRTYRYPITILQTYPAIAQNFATMIQQMPSAVLKYKRLQDLRSKLLEYLADLAVGDEPGS